MSGQMSLKAAVDEIAEVCTESAVGSFSFFMIVGAGVSWPSIPLAAKITEECRLKAESAGRSHAPPGASPMQNYSHWFGEAHRQPLQRQRYLRDLVEQGKITPANLRIAHLLLSRRFTNLVVTTNFDDYISRALYLFGERHIVCDHPKTASRIEPDRSDLQVVHAHGSFWFYDCCNLTEEIKDRSHLSEQTNETIGSLLDAVLRTRSPIVLGYSGWEGDVIMKALRRRMNNRLSHNLYWFCYQHSNADSLPSWLTEHQDVRFIVPAEDDEFSTLSADTVLDSLVRNLELNPPKLTVDPFGFFAEELKSILPVSAKDVEEDIYRIGEVIARLERVPALEAKDKESQGWAAIDRSVFATRQSQYLEAIEESLKVDWSSLTENQQMHLVLTVFLATVRMDQAKVYEPGRILTGSEAFERLFDKLPSRFRSDSEIMYARVAVAVVKAINIGRSGEREKEFALYDQITREFWDANDLRVKDQVLRALVNKGMSHAELGQSVEAIQAFTAVLDRYASSPAPILKEWLARALYFRGYEYKETGQADLATSDFQRLIEEFADANDPAVFEWVQGGRITLEAIENARKKGAEVGGRQPPIG